VTQSLIGPEFLSLQLFVTLHLFDNLSGGEAGGRTGVLTLGPNTGRHREDGSREKEASDRLEFHSGILSRNR
jgi:hypothetical protein